MSASPGFDPEAARHAVLTVVASIPAGAVASYGQVAREAGLPGRARWVGRVLSEGEARGWHRVLRSDGRLGVAPGSAAHAEQRVRLEAEGHDLARGRVDLATRRWRPHRDAPLLD